jgi:c(7)-type cytochrome triheme protein
MRRRTGVLLASLAGAVLLAPLVGLAVPDTVRIPIARPHPAGTPQAEALFSHWGHNSYRCLACHPSIFPQARLSFTHGDMNQGRFCARCHGATDAPPVPSYRCERCHVAR